ncbi:MAG: glycosyltransferase family 4 protein [Acidimicrobiia bacterium]|nr:glycosyltransferase family 4 protein [Acidimicrobiia bacterium]
MRIAFNAEQLLHPVPGGIGTYCRALLGAFAARDDVDVVAFTALHPRAAVRAALADVGLRRDAARVPLPRPLLYDAWHALRLPPLPWFGQGLGAVDVIHAPSVAVPPRQRTPLVVTVHDVAPLLFPETFPRRGVRFHTQGLHAAERADLVIAVSEAAAAEIRGNTGIDPARIRVVPNGVDPTPAPPATVTDVLRAHGLADVPYLLWVGSLEPRKNVGTLVSAFAELASASQTTHRLVLVGPSGWLDGGLVPEDARASLADRLLPLGAVPAGHLKALYAGADLVAVPSIHEGFGLPVLEAMAQGTPVVCSDIPSLREVSDGAAYLVDPRSVAAWTAALGRVLDDRVLRARFVTAGYERAARFSWARCAESTLAVYREAIG